MQFLDEKGVKVLWAAVKKVDQALDAKISAIDKTFAEVVTALPTTDIKKHLYLLLDSGASGVNQNKYSEFVYTGALPINETNTYNASKWEKMGDFQAEVDLTPYSKKTETVKGLRAAAYGNNALIIVDKADGTTSELSIVAASANANGNSGNADGTDANSGRILFQTEGNDGGYAIIGHDGDQYLVSVSRDVYDNSKTTYISSDGISVSSTKKIGDDINKVEINSNGITLSNIEGVPSNCVFMTDGTIQELTAISTEELNKILV